MLEFDVVILADGEFPFHEIPLKVLDEASFLICCDNAGKRLIEMSGRVPDAIVGDGDSLPVEFKERYSDIYHQVDEQDYNDLTKATRYAIGVKGGAGRPLRVAYVGATGKREDHTIGNVSLMEFYRRELGVEPVMITDYGVFAPYCGDAVIPAFKGQQVSVFNLTSKRMSSEGLKWNIGTYNEWWQGTLNEALGDSVAIHSDGAYIVYLTHDRK